MTACFFEIFYLNALWICLLWLLLGYPFARKSLELSLRIFGIHQKSKQNFYYSITILAVNLLLAFILTGNLLVYLTLNIVLPFLLMQRYSGSSLAKSTPKDMS